MARLDVVECDVLYGWYDWTLLSVTYFVDGTLDGVDCDVLCGWYTGRC